MVDISPDNHWVLYVGEVASQKEVFVRSLRGDSPAIRVSAESAVFAAFGKTGETIYLGSGSAPPSTTTAEFWSVDWQTEPEPKIGEPHTLFELEDLVFVTDFDTERDRFLGMRQEVAEGRQILLKTGWTDLQSAR